MTTARIGALEKRLADVEKRLAKLDEIEREVRESRLMQDPDRILSLREVAALIGKSPKTILNNWLPRPYTRRRWRVDLLLQRDPAGRYYSTPRQIAIWKREISREVPC